MSDKDKEEKDDDGFDFWNPKYYEHDDVMFPWRKGEKIPGVNASPDKKEKRGCLSILFGELL